MTKCDCLVPEHGSMIHDQRCTKGELDALAEKIFITRSVLDEPFSEIARYSYEIAQDFLDYKKSRGGK